MKASTFLLACLLIETAISLCETKFPDNVRSETAAYEVPDSLKTYNDSTEDQLARR